MACAVSASCSIAGVCDYVVPDIQTTDLHGVLHTHTLTLSLHRSMSRSSDTTEHRPAPGRFVFSIVHWVETIRITRAEGCRPLGGANLYNDRLFFSRPRSEGWPHHGLRAWRKVMAAYRRVYDSRHLQVDCQ